LIRVTIPIIIMGDDDNYGDTKSGDGSGDDVNT
jgi:hypothetical protein